MSEEILDQEVETKDDEVIEAREEDEGLHEERFDSSVVQHRGLDAEASPIDEETRTVQIAISSEEPYERYFGMEILGHTKSEIDMDFLASGRAPLLLDHDPHKQIGVIESVELDEKAGRLRANVRFGKGELAQEAFADVVDEIKGNISVGYRINDMTLVSKKGDEPSYRVTSWRPVEASLVSIPADVTVGVGRSDDTSTETRTDDVAIPHIEPKLKEDSVMTDIDLEAVKAEAAKTAQRNAAEIIELGARHNQSDMAREAVAKGLDVASFRGELLEKIGSDKALDNQDIGMKKDEVKRFSLVRAIHAMANPTDRKAQEDAAFEFECSRAAADLYGKTAQGIMIPAEVMQTWGRDLSMANDSAISGEDFRAGAFIDVLRNASSVMASGATTLGGLSGDVKIPKKLTAASAGWISTEGGAAAESEMTVGQVSLAPKTLGAYTDVTRQLMIQSSLDVENLVRDDLVQAMALAIDLAGLEGSGASGQPTGLLNTTGVTKVTTFAGVNPTFAEAVSLETAVADNNALRGSLGYILRSNMNGALKTTALDSGSGRFVSEGGMINGYNARISNQGTDGNIYFGNWADMLIGMFGGLDIIVDPYTNSTSGTLRITALQSVDVGVRHAASFAYGNDTA